MYDLVIKKWFNEDSAIEYVLREYSDNEKKENEKVMDSFLEKVDKYFKKKPVKKSFTIIWEEEGKEIFKTFFKEDKVFNLNCLSKDFQDAVIEMTRKFIYDARAFDKKISKKDIIQALRNIWITAILQVMLDTDVACKKSIFAYSMIYPYSDNFLDDKNVSIKEKNKFNKKIYAMLKGSSVCIESDIDKKVYTLIKYIEEEYDRKKYPGVYRSLIEIQKGQEKSLKQMKKLYVPYETDVLDISIRKGGASVLADGYLAKGKLSTKEEEFCLMYGALLQLVDDFQDLKDDKENNYSTIMSQLAGRYHLDNIINKLMNFAHSLFNGAQLLKEKDKLKKVMESNCLVLILCSIVLNKEYFTSEYVSKNIKYVPFSAEYIERLDKTLKKKTEVLI